MKLVKVISITALMSVSAASSAWWGNGWDRNDGYGWGDGRGYGDGYGYGYGDGSGYGSGYSRGRGDGRAYGDGDMDVLSAAFLGNAVAWYENDGNQNFTKRTIATDFRHHPVLRFRS